MRKAVRPNPGKIPQGKTVQFPAPVKGWMTQESPVDADEKSALILDNFFPEPQGVRVRRGYTSHKTGMTGNVESLLIFTSATASKMFAANGTAVYDATSAGAIGAAVVSTTVNARWQQTMFATSGGQFLTIVNGAAGVRTYDGTTWVDRTASITGTSGAVDTFIAITAHKKRLWFAPVNSTNLWYLPTESVAGAAALFPIGAQFKRGGSIMAIGTWSVDAGDGMDDLFVAVSTEGEIVIYAGTDPASNFELVGVFQVGQPLGRRCLFQVGADLAILSEDGVIPLSMVFRGDADRAVASNKALSRNIREGWAESSQRASTLFGWEMVAHPFRNMALVNVPAGGGELTWQFAFNTISGGWARFKNQEANCWASFNDQLYFGGTDGKVYRADYGASDNDTPIMAKMLPAYLHLGPKGRLKHVKGIRPIYSTDIPGVAPAVTVAVDYELPTESAAVQNVTEGYFTWDTSLWDGPDVYYGYVVQRAWRGSGNIGTVISPYTTISIDETAAGSEFKFVITGFDVLYELGGVL